MDKIKVILHLDGDPRPGMLSLANCHGYSSFVPTEASDFIKKLFAGLSIWGGATDTYRTRDNEHWFSFYELDCRCLDFLLSESFKILCSRNDAEPIIVRGGENEDALRDFHNQYRTYWN